MWGLGHAGLVEFRAEERKPPAQTKQTQQEQSEVLNWYRTTKTTRAQAGSKIEAIDAKQSQLTTLSYASDSNVGALIPRIGFGAYYKITIMRNPQNPMPILKAPTLLRY